MSKDMSSVRHARLSKFMALLQSKTKASHEEIFAEGQYPSERTFQNDLRYLRETYGAEISYDRANKLYVLEGTGSFKLDLSVSSEEAEALAAGLKLAAHIFPNLKDASDSLFKKILSVIPEKAVSRGADAAKAVCPALPSAEFDANIFKSLLDAKASRKAVHVRYSVPDKEPVQWLISPYEIYFKNGALRLAGYNHERKSLSLFNISRITGVSGARDGYIAPERAGLNSADLAGAINAVKGGEKRLIRLKAEAGGFADYIRNMKLKAGQKIENTQNGGIILTAEIPYIEELLKEAIAG